jgi:hypothetical protein
MNSHLVGIVAFTCFLSWAVCGALSFGIVYVAVHQVRRDPRNSLEAGTATAAAAARRTSIKETV